jgi:hypothetical protein
VSATLSHVCCFGVSSSSSRWIRWNTRWYTTDVLRCFYTCTIPKTHGESQQTLKCILLDCWRPCTRCWLDLNPLQASTAPTVLNLLKIDKGIKAIEWYHLDSAQTSGLFGHIRTDRTSKERTGIDGKYVSGGYPGYPGYDISGLILKMSTIMS